MTDRNKAQRKVLSRRRVDTGILEQVSKNVYVIDIDFSEPTGEDYFKTSPEYDNLQDLEHEGLARAGAK